MASAPTRGILAGLAAGLGRRSAPHRRPASSSSASTSGARARTKRRVRGHRPAALHRDAHASRAATDGARAARSATPPRSGPTARPRPPAVGGLLSKARGDYRRLLAALYAAGYYGPAISIRAAGQEVADLTLAVDLPPPVPVVIDVGPARRSDFGAHRDRQRAAGGRRRRRRGRDRPPRSASAPASRRAPG